MLWGCYKIVNHEFSTLFYYLRTLPSFNPVTWSWGLWEMWLPLNEPSIAKKQHGLPASGGCVWGRPHGGEPHTADQACSTRFRRSLGDAAPQGTRRPQVSEHTHLLLLCNTTSPLHWKKKNRRHTSVPLKLCKKNVSCLPSKANCRIVTACCLGNTDRYFLLI